MKVELAPNIVRALRTFRDQFPKLYAENPGRWAACDGRGVVGVGDDPEPLYLRCLESGLQEDEFVVLCLLPDAAESID